MYNYVISEPHSTILHNVVTPVSPFLQYTYCGLNVAREVLQCLTSKYFLLQVKGFQVPPAELESLLREHPSVNDAAVVGVPHQTKGETPKAFVVLKSGHKCSQKELSEFVNQKVAAYKQVDDIMFIDIVPKSSSGKILRRVLKEQYC